MTSSSEAAAAATSAQRSNESAQSPSCICCATCACSLDNPVTTEELMVAASTGDFHFIRHAVCVLKRDVMERTDDDGLTALHFASKKGHLPIIKFLLHCVCDEGSSDCSLACCNLSVDAEEDPRALASSFSSAISGSSHSTSSSVGRIDSAKNTTITNKAEDVSSPSPSATDESLNFSKKQIKAMSSVTTRSTASAESHTQISSASSRLSDSPIDARSDSSTAKPLPSVSVSVADQLSSTTRVRSEWSSKRTLRGHTALHWAAIKGHATVVQELLIQGFEVDAVSNQGATALQLATAADKSDVAKILIAAGGDPYALTKSGSSPVSAAKYLRRQSLLDLFTKSSSCEVELNNTTSSSSSS